jgi:capsule polysaccharide modification protein KpsS
MPANVLLLQGPVGPFFRRLAEDLARQGFRVYKVNLNGGDRLFHRREGALSFTGTWGDWPAFLEQQLVDLRIARIYLFGDARPYHMVARDVAARLGIRVFVFEEGYLRPDYITLEEEGVNGYSRMPREPRAYRAMSTSISEPPRPVGNVFGRTALYAMAYYIACRLSKAFPHYRHHRPLSVWGEGSRWILSGLRKMRFAVTERQVLERVSTGLAGRYFLVPLQVHCDMQVLHHSSFESIEEFIERVISSFAAHAPTGDSLVFKHHPMDRGYRDYTQLIMRKARALGMDRRALYVHDLPLPTLLRRARGTVVINSTVGLSSIHHGTPVKVLGQAVYDMSGLTAQMPLHRFWRAPGTPDRELYQRFRAYLVGHSQLNGNLYKRLPGVASALGVIWPTMRCDETNIEPIPPFEGSSPTFGNLIKEGSA